MPAPATTILFGACDRHNLGDLLFPHIAAALMPGRPVRFAGLVARDMRPYGGHAVDAIADLVRELGSMPLNLVHVGGEILTCDSWAAAAMLLDEADARATLADAGHAAARAAWAATTLGTGALAPYVLAKERLAQGTTIVHDAVGGATLDGCDAALRGEVLAALRGADVVTVRDRRTQLSLAREGIDAALLPDPGVMVAELFGVRIAAARETVAVAPLARAFPQGYLAVQFSADFADDGSLNTLAAQFDQLAAATPYGLVLFRAGAAPLHDDLALLRTVRHRMRSGTRTTVFESLNIWDICALIAGSRGFLGSSLHGRILALAHALPRVTLATTPAAPGKHRAFVESWEIAAMPAVVGLNDASQAMLTALEVPRAPLAEHARQLAALHRSGCAGWLRRLG
jgi:hypothetical protein